MINSDFLDSPTKEEVDDYFQLQNEKEIELIQTKFSYLK